MPWKISKKADGIYQVAGYGKHEGTFTFSYTAAIIGGGFLCTSHPNPGSKEHAANKRDAEAALREHLHPKNKYREAPA